MKKIISILLSIAIIASFSSCGMLNKAFEVVKEASETVSDAQQNIETPSEVQSSLPESSEENIELTETYMKTTAVRLLNEWDNYDFLGVCCETEGNYEDLLRSYISQEHLDTSAGLARCVCCNTIEEAKAHIAKCMDPSLDVSGLSERLYEIEGQLYVSVGAMGASVHNTEDFDVQKITDDMFTITSEYGLGDFAFRESVFSNDTFTVERRNGDFVITAIDVEEIEYIEPSEPESSEPESSKPAEDNKKNQLVVPDEIYEIGYHCYVNADGGLNMRYGPGKEYGKIALIPNGTPLVELGYKDSWIYVEYDGKYGWVSTEFVAFEEGGMAKPVIYLYPTKKTDVKVSLDITKGNLTCTYPQYNNGWSVTAYPNGKIINKADGLEYSYLYWEAESDIRYDLSEGFVVRGEDTAAFLQKTLSKMGLTPKEYNEFIVYWLPLMQNNKYNLITFQNEEYTDAAKLSISPKPDSMLRVYMAFKALDKPVKVKTPVIEGFERKGFTVVEWGGTEIK